MNIVLAVYFTSYLRLENAAHAPGTKHTRGSLTFLIIT